MKKLMIFSFSLILLMLFVSTWIIMSNVRGLTLADIKNSGVIRIGYAEEAPYAFLLEDGTLTGESPAVATAIAQRLGIENTQWILTEFGSLIPGLLAGDFDMIACGMFITAERAEQVQFTRPCFHVRDALLVQAGNPYQLNSYADAALNHSVRIAVLGGSVEETALLQTNISTTRLLRFADAESGYIAVRLGKADCLALSSPTIRWMVAKETDHDVEMASMAPGQSIFDQQRLGYGAFAFRPADKKLLSAWNKELDRFIGTEAHLALIEPFGFTEQELPGEVTTKEIIAQ